jgi:hypothetical protein
MTCSAADVPLCIRQGATFTDIVRFAQPSWEWRQISTIEGSPVKITAPNHDIVGDWVVWVEGVQGMPSINNDRKARPHDVQVVDDDTLIVNALSAYGLSPTGGVLAYNPPVILDGCSVKMQIKDKIGGTVLFELSTANGRIEIVRPGTIRRTIDAGDTAGFAWLRGVYDLEVTYPDDTVQRYLQGAVTVSKEVTT